MLAVAVGAVAAGICTPVAANPVLSTVAPDPSVIRTDDGAFHVIASSDDWADGAGLRIASHFRSFDLLEWEYVGDSFTSLPAWAPADSFLWAPEIVPMSDGSMAMYFTTGGDAPCIGRATAPGVHGPWVYDPAPMVCKGAPAPYAELDPMDPEVVLSADGPILYMGNFESIHAVSLTADGSALVGDPVQVAGAGIEAPLVLERQGEVFMLASAGHCCLGENSPYRVVAGRADNLYGPFRDRSGHKPLSGASQDILLQGDSDWVGPGHVDVTTDDAGQDWIIYHAAPRGRATLPNGVQRRYLMIDELDWSGRWPVVGDGTPSTIRTSDPVVDTPVRLDAAGAGTLSTTDTGGVFTAPIRLSGGAAAFTGILSAQLTGPGRAAKMLEIPDPGVSLAAGERQTTTIDLELPAALRPGRYEIGIRVADDEGRVRELAMFAFEISATEPPVTGVDAMGSSGIPPMGSVGQGSFAAGPAGSLRPAGSAGSAG